MGGLVISTLVGKNGLISKIKLAEENNSIEFSYELISDENDKFKILIEVKDENNGMDIIESPNGHIQRCNGKKIVGIEYEVNEGEDYIFIARNRNGIEKREVLNLIKPVEPIIQVQNIAYPVLTLTNVDVPKIEIKYDEREDFENYYSIDGGKTWNKYIEPVCATKTIMAKSKNKKCTGIYTEITTEAIIEDSTAIGINAYDIYRETGFAMATYPNPSEASILIDKSIWNQTINIIATSKYQSGLASGVKLTFLNDEEEKIGDIINLCNGDMNIDKDIIIPENSKKMKIYYGDYQGLFVIYDLSLVNTPEIKFNSQHYAKITKDGIESSYSIVSIEYYSESVDKLYKIDDGEWKKYEGEIYLGENETIYAKGIDKNGIETKTISEKFISKSDTISNAAFDNDKTTCSVINTYPNQGKFYMEIDSNAIGKKLDFYVSNVYYSGLGGGTEINFLDANLEKIQNITTLSNNGTRFLGGNIEIPINSKYLEFSISIYGGPVSIYEITAKD